MTVVKICGITTYKDALFAAQVGADMLGLNFSRQSPRYIDPDTALAICDPLREALGEACPLLVGIFVNESVGAISMMTNHVGLDAAQLSGDESDEMLAELRGIAYKGIQPMNKAMALEDIQYYTPQFPQNEHLPSILVDAYHAHLRGGTGHQASDEVAIAARESVPRLMLAGGLTADNVVQRIDAVKPWGVDIASGVEIADQPGIKDHEKMQAFIQAAKS